VCHTRSASTDSPVNHSLRRVVRKRGEREPGATVRTLSRKQALRCLNPKRCVVGRNRSR
jgi:hypothetical protein